jgi:hypothetical protein
MTRLKRMRAMRRTQETKAPWKKSRITVALTQNRLGNRTGRMNTHCSEVKKKLPKSMENMVKTRVERSIALGDKTDMLRAIKARSNIGLS